MIGILMIQIRTIKGEMYRVVNTNQNQESPGKENKEREKGKVDNTNESLKSIWKVQDVFLLAIKRTSNNQRNKDHENTRREMECEEEIELDENDVFIDKYANAKFMLNNERSIRDNDWILMGDMNITLNTNEHSEGSSHVIQDMRDFQDCVNEIEMEDLCNHSPAILICLGVVKKSHKAFRLANYVTEKEEFGDIVKNGWKKDIQGHAMFQLVHKLKSLKPQLNNLNWENGNLFNILREEEVKLLEEYINAAHDEEKLLCQKAKVEWLKDGDRNSSYFYKVLKGNLNRSKIHTVMGTNGVIHEKDNVGIEFFKHFESFLGTTSDAANMDDSDGFLFNKIDDNDVEYMSKEINQDEIKIALFDIDDNKAPGPDEFTSKFFKKARVTIKEDFCKAIKEFFRTRMLLGEMNATLITLKAYDTVSWSFLEKILHNYGFPNNVIQWIMVCISTCKFIICVNGERVRYFKRGRGLRQGDPIFTYLFTLVMEVLNMFLKDEIAKEKNFKYHYGCQALEKFSKVSVLHPNMSKSTMVFGSLSEEENNQFLNILLFKMMNLPVRCLGVPLMDKKIGVKDCKNLVAKLTRGKAWIAWKDVWKLKDQGGLALKPLDLCNKTLLIKHLWNIVANKESLWVKWINTVKLKRRSIWDTKSYGSDEWVTKYNFLSSILVPKLGESTDKALWVTKQGKMVNFNTSQAWTDIRRDGEKVKPHSHEHLFFQCKTVADVWEIVKGKARIKTNVMGWKCIIKDIANNTNGASLESFVWLLLYIMYGKRETADSLILEA
ncbi:RNA-directed DNA polymerase, eukaryota, reverse transcriptase zinc-binding domain protein [Tanacetum coccineum]